MKKIVFTVVLASMAVFEIAAQDVFCPTQEGVALLYADMNAKGKVEQYIR